MEKSKLDENKSQKRLYGCNIKEQRNAKMVDYDIQMLCFWLFLYESRYVIIHSTEFWKTFNANKRAWWEFVVKNAVLFVNIVPV